MSDKNIITFENSEVKARVYVSKEDYYRIMRDAKDHNLAEDSKKKNEDYPKTEDDYKYGAH